MGRFNLNQILSDTSKAAAGGGSAKPRPSESRYEKLSVFDLVPSEDNFYSMREIGELKAAIEIAGKVLQNLVVVPLGDGKYKVIAGHRRRLASIELVNGGKPEYEFVPCVIEPTEEAADEQEIRDGLDLIVTNSQREKTAWDKIEEVRYLREVLEKAKTKPRFVELLRRIVEKTFEDGELQTDGTRDFIAKVLHTSTTQIGRYDTIIRHLSPEFTEELKADRINLSTAYELAGLPAENQNAAFKEYHLTGAISIKAAREWKRPAPPAPPAEDTATPTQAERPQKEREPVVERDKVPDTQATPPYSAAVERDTADGTQDTKPTESTQQSAPRRPQATRSSECGICPYCGAKFDAAKVMLSELQLLIAKEADLQSKIAKIENGDPDALYIDRVVEMCAPKSTERLEQQQEKLETLRRKRDDLTWEIDSGPDGKPPSKAKQKQLDALQCEIAALEDTTADRQMELEKSSYKVNMQTVIKASAFDRAMKLEAELNKIHGRIIKLLDSIKGYEMESRRLRLEERKYNLAKQKLSGAFDVDPETGEIIDEVDDPCGDPEI